MSRVKKLGVESLERRSLLAGDLMSALGATANANPDLSLDEVAIQADAAGGGALSTGLVDASTNVGTDVDATLSLGLSGPVNDVLGFANSLLGNLQNTAGNALSNVTGAVGNAVDNVGDTADDLTGNVTDTADDLVDDVGDTVDDAVGDVGDTTDDVADDLGLGDVIDSITDTTPVNDLLDNLGEVLNVDDLAGSLGLGNLPDTLTIDQVHGINGLIQSQGQNLNGFIHSLPGKVSHLTNDVGGAVNHAGADSVFAAIGRVKHGLLG